MNSTPKISFSEINKLAIPAIFAGIVEPLISLTDTAVAGRLTENADIALGAVGLVGSFLSAMVWIFLQSSNAISALVAQAYGRKTLKSTQTLVAQLLYFNLLISLVLCGAVYFFSLQIFELYGAENHLLEYCLRYVKIRLWGFPLTLFTFTIFGVFRGLQNTGWAMQISILGGILNVILDLLFVFIFDWEIEGIALASLAAQLFMSVLVWVYLKRNTDYKLTLSFPIHPDFVKTLKMSFDLIIRSLSLNLALFLAFRYATLLGDSQVAAHTLLIQIWLFSAFLLDGYSTAGSAIAGKLFGAKELDKLNRLVVDLVKIVFAIGCGLVFIYSLGYSFLGTLLTDSAKVLSVFEQVFWLVIISQPLNSIAFLFDGIYKGLAETVVLRNVFIEAALLGFVPSLLLFHYLGWGLQGIWFSFIVWICFRILGLGLHYKRKLLKADNSLSRTG